MRLTQESMQTKIHDRSHRARDMDPDVRCLPRRVGQYWRHVRQDAHVYGEPLITAQIAKENMHCGEVRRTAYKY